MSWTLTNFLAAFLLPPLNLFMLGLAGLFLRGRRRMLGGLLIGASLLGLVVLSTPIVSFWLLDSLKPAPVPITGKEADAIVILGGGRDINSLEFGGDTLSRYSLERARYGAWLARRLGKPVLVTGGMPGGGSRSEGEIMAEALNREFGVKVRWVEDQAETPVKMPACRPPCWFGTVSTGSIWSPTAGICAGPCRSSRPRD